MTFPSSLPHPPPMAPPSQLPFKHMPPAAAETSSEESTTTSSSSSSVSLNLSLLIIFAIIAFVFATSASIHLLLRLLSSRRRTSSVAAVPPLPPPSLHQSRSDSSSSPAAAAPDSGLSEKDRAALVDSLPLFSLASSLASLPKSSLDCAVCLYSFRPHDELRLLPACRHAFHSQCVDPWLRSTPSCPLCRTSINVPAPLQLPPPPPEAVAANGDTSRPGSFRVQIGSVSRRRAQLEVERAANPLSHVRTFSLGSSFEYVVDEEVEAVVSPMRRLTEKEEKREVVVAYSATEPAPAPPGAEVVEAVGGGGRGWLREHVDRLASSASSSFSSFRFSGRWSHRYDGGGGGRHSWDLEGSARLEAEEGGYYGLYRWLIGV